MVIFYCLFFCLLCRLDSGADSWICNAAKDVYEFSMHVIGSQHVGCSDELIVDGFDNEQIWQQIELYNNSILNHHEHQIDVLIKGKDGIIKKKQKVRPSSAVEKKKVTFDSEINKHESDIDESDDAGVCQIDGEDLPDDEAESEEDKELEELLKKVSGKDSGLADDGDLDDMDDDFGDGSDSDEHDDSVGNEDVSDSDEDDSEKKKSSVKSLKEKLKQLDDKNTAKLKKSVVDDKFFKLSEMEAFLDEQDKKAMRSKPGTNDDEESEEDLTDEEDDEGKVNSSSVCYQTVTRIMYSVNELLKACITMPNM
jgi:U3 small nucleolar RNA-associated protein MPP10